MKFLRNLLNYPETLPIVIVLAIGLVAGATMLHAGYFNMHDDLQMMRQLEMEKCFKDWQIPCRWVPDMGYGYGFPLFNYYPPLPYLIGQVIRLTGVSFITTVKLTFLLSILISGVGMYLLSRQFWGQLGAIVSSAFYIWAPYHAVDVFVRGAMNESWALTWFPFVLWSTYRLFKDYSRKWVILTTLSWFALLTSHNLMAIIFAPVYAVWVVFWLWRLSAQRHLPRLIISGIWALGLAAFFSIPVLFEQKQVHIETLTAGYYEYVAHFANIHQLLFSRFWGYGASVWGDEDKMAFQVGYVHWITSLLVGLTAFVYLLIKRKSARLNIVLVIFFFLAVGWFATFMAHSKSTPIWLKFGQLAIVQFPWRFLTLVILSFSIISGAIIMFFGQINVWFGRIAVVLLILSVMWYSKDYFRPEWMGPLTDQEKFSNAAWELQQTAGIYDYLPKQAKIAPQGPRKEAVSIVEGSAQVSDIKEGTNWLTANTNVTSDNAVIRINTFDFPNWKVFIDGKKTKTFYRDEDQLGLMYINVSGGEHLIKAKLYNTPIRTFSNVISILSWLILLAVFLGKRLTSNRV